MNEKKSCKDLKGMLKLATTSHRELESVESRTRLYLVRHGEVTTSSEWRYIGHMDVELTETGIHQMELIGKKLADEHIDIILSSDLKRTRKGAEIIAGMLGLNPEAHPDLREINLGAWEGMTRDEIISQYRKDFEKRANNIAAYKIEGGESFFDLQKRVIKRLESYLEQYHGKNILLIGHGGVNRVILCHVLGLEINNLIRIDQAYGCLNIIDYFDEGIAVVRLMNANCHE